MGDWSRIDVLVEHIVTEYKRIDILINNAGINPQLRTIEYVDKVLWDKVYDVNLKGPLRLCARVAPIMADNGGGSIINISSTGAYQGARGLGAYTSSKAALMNLTATLAAEWALQNVRVNSLSPGPFNAGMNEGKSDDWMDLAARGALMRRIAEPEEIVGTVLYLASDASSFVTGEDIKVAGGYLPSDGYSDLD